MTVNTISITHSFPSNALPCLSPFPADLSSYSLALRWLDARECAEEASSSLKPVWVQVPVT